jgi:hypothetical protein
VALRGSPVAAAERELEKTQARLDAELEQVAGEHAALAALAAKRTETAADPAAFEQLEAAGRRHALEIERRQLLLPALRAEVEAATRTLALAVFEDAQAVARAASEQAAKEAAAFDKQAVELAAAGERLTGARAAADEARKHAQHAFRLCPEELTESPPTDFDEPDWSIDKPARGKLAELILAERRQPVAAEAKRRARDELYERNRLLAKARQAAEADRMREQGLRRNDAGELVPARLAS